MIKEIGQLITFFGIATLCMSWVIALGTIAEISSWIDVILAIVGGIAMMIIGLILWEKGDSK